MGVVGTLGPEFKGSRAGGAVAPPRELRVVKKPISGSLTLLAKGSHGGGDVLEDLPLSVLDAPEVKRARTARPRPEIKVDVYTCDPDPPATAEDKAPAKVEAPTHPAAEPGAPPAVEPEVALPVTAETPDPHGTRRRPASPGSPALKPPAKDKE